MVKRRRRWTGNLLGVALLLSILLVSAAFVRKAVRPVWLNHCEGYAVRQLQLQCEAAEKHNHRLKCDINLYKSKSGALAASRELGYVRPGETPVSIEEPKQSR